MGTLVRTLDVDGVTDEVRLREILSSVSKCLRMRELFFRVSASGNGYHVRIECQAPGMCDACRLAFDSDFRFMLDTLFRGEHQRNVLWRQKVYCKGENRMTGIAGPWMKYVVRTRYRWYEPKLGCVRPGTLSNRGSPPEPR